MQAGLIKRLKRTNKYILLVLILQAAIVLPFLLKLPPIDNVGDESWMMNISWSILEHGKATAPMHVGTPIADSPSITTLWIYNGLLSLAILIGGNSIVTGRLLSFFVSLGLIVFLYAFGKRIRDEYLGLGASLILVSNIFFSFHSRETRPEMVFAFIILASVFYLYRALFEKDGKNVRYLFLAGLLVTLSVESHPNGVDFAITMLTVYAFYSYKSLFSKRTLSLIGGMALGTGLWIVMNYLPMDTGSFSTIHAKYIPPILNEPIMSIIFKGLPALPGENLSPRWVVNVLDHYYSSLHYSVIYVMLLLPLCSLLAFKEGRNKKLFLISFVLLPIIVSRFFGGFTSWMHYFSIIPFVVILIAWTFYDVAGWARNRRKLIYAILTLALCVYGMSDIARATSKLSGYDYYKIKKELRASVPEGASVMGTSVHYFSFIDRPEKYMSVLFIENSCPDFTQSVKAFGPDYIIVDSALYSLSKLWCPLSSDGNRYFDREIQDFVFKNATLVKKITTPYPSALGVENRLGTIYVFRVKKKFYNNVH